MKFKVGDKIVSKRGARYVVTGVDTNQDLYTVSIDIGNNNNVFTNWRASHLDLNYRLVTETDLPVGCPVTEKCIHDWKEYIGLNETFIYCTKCDAKK
jgi:hypothetical protein